MLVDGEDNGYFRAMIASAKGGDPVFFSLDPTFTERVRLERRPSDDQFGLLHFYTAETVCQFFAAGDPDTLRRDLISAYEAVRYHTDVALTSSLALSGTAQVDVVAHGRERGWLGFVLPSALGIDSLTVAGREASWAQEKDNDMVWVRVSPPIAAGETATLRFRYHGDAFERTTGSGTRTCSPGCRAPGTAAPPPGTCASPSRATISWSRRASGYRSKRPGRCSARAGSSSTRSSWCRSTSTSSVGIRVDRDTLPVTVWMRHMDGAGKVTVETPARLRDARDDDQKVAFDVANCLEFFERVFGMPPSREFHALETPERIYAAYPGMIHMMLAADRVAGHPSFSPPVLRAHEISHQWFGLGADNATYHDAWLSEGFADFCSIWYVQAARKDAKTYLDVLAKWHADLLENRKFVLGENQQAGPVWLGHRTNSSSTPDDYNLVVYEKGAWVLHMLRNYLLQEGNPAERTFAT